MRGDVVEIVNINVDEFNFPIEVVAMEMNGNDIVQMILGRPFLATAWIIINVDQGEIIIRSGEDYITYKVFGQYCYLSQRALPKETVSLKVDDREEDKEPEGHGLPSTR
jgi:hypothetical protein